MSLALRLDAQLRSFNMKIFNFSGSGGGGGAGTVTSIAPADSTLTFTPNPITTTGTIGINLANANTWTAVQTFNAQNIITTPTNGALLSNTTPSTLGVPVQISPALEFTGRMFRTGDSSNNTGTFRMYEIPVSGATAGATHAGTLQWDSSKNGVYQLNIMNLGRTGILTAASNVISGGSITANGGITSTTGMILATASQVQAGTDLLTGTNGVSAGHLYMYGGTSGNFSISAPSAVTNYNSVWPAAQGIGALTNDGAGNLSWTPSGGTISTDFTLTGDGSGGSPLGINLAHSNTWTTAQTFEIGTFFGKVGGASGELDLRGSTSGKVSIKAPTTITDYDITLPSAVASSNGQALVSTTGGITSWATITSAPAAPINLTGQTAAITATTIFTPSATGFFRISVYEQVTVAASVSSILGGATGTVITYQDGDGGIGQSITVPFADAGAGGIVTTNAGNTTTTLLQGTIVIYAKVGVAVQYAIGYTSVGGTPMAYGLHIRTESV